MNALPPFPLSEDILAIAAMIMLLRRAHVVEPKAGGSASALQLALAEQFLHTAAQCHM